MIDLCPLLMAWISARNTVAISINEMRRHFVASDFRSASIGSERANEGRLAWSSFHTVDRLFHFGQEPMRCMFGWMYRCMDDKLGGQIRSDLLYDFDLKLLERMMRYVEAIPSREAASSTMEMD